MRLVCDLSVLRLRAKTIEPHRRNSGAARNVLPLALKAHR
jgi:hypothetical protein